MMVKRKPNSHVVCVDPKKKTMPKKVQSKAELIQEIAALKALNDALEDENKKNRETISKLEEKISLKIHKSIDIVNAGCQTLDSDLLLCEECEYPAETLYELGEHVGESHSGLRIPCNFCPDIYTSKEELEDHVTEVHNHFEDEHLNKHQDIRIFKCRFGEKKFQSKSDLMKHNKSSHIENLSACWNFKTGTCYFDNNDCWFSHEQKKINATSEFKCNLCESKFNTVPELLKHRKAAHVEKVALCRNFTRDNCSFGNGCFFIHNGERIPENVDKKEIN